VKYIFCRWLGGCAAIAVLRYGILDTYCQYQRKNATPISGYLLPDSTQTSTLYGDQNPSKGTKKDRKKKRERGWRGNWTRKKRFVLGLDFQLVRYSGSLAMRTGIVANGSQDGALYCIALSFVLPYGQQEWPNAPGYDSNGNNS